ncbi:MAG: PDZ domain-containing protein [Elusimicrobiota bacterium]
MINLIFKIIVLFSLPSSSLTLPSFQSEINQMVNKTKDAVVNVRIFREGYASVIEPEFFFGYLIPEEKIYKYKIGGIGSGVIISEDGYVVTNYHVIEGADEISVESYENNRKTVYKASYAGGDKKLDIAILKIKSGKKFNYLTFSKTPVNIGDIVLAIGYPFGFKQTYTMGIVSSKNVSLKVEGKAYNDLIQTDAAINQGNSGGPLVNIYGEIVGINSAIYSPSGAFAGVGFAIPSWKVKEVVDEIIYKKPASRGWLGISLLPTDIIMKRIMSADIPKGGIINMVYKNSPAYNANLKRGDIIVSIDDEDIENDEDLSYKVYYKKPGDKIRISYIRDGKKLTTEVILAQRPSEKELSNLLKENNNETKESEKSKDIYEVSGVEFKYTKKGAIVSKITQNSVLKGYLKEGDIIVSINNKKITSKQEMVNILSNLDFSDGALFDIIRDGEPFYLSIQIK